MGSHLRIFSYLDFPSVIHLSPGVHSLLLSFLTLKEFYMKSDKSGQSCILCMEWSADSEAEVLQAVLCLHTAVKGNTAYEHRAF